MSKQLALSNDMKKAATEPTHSHEWQVNAGDGIYANCKAPFCLAQLDWDEVDKHINERDAWKEAFLATRAYYSNNNGPNSTRYRAAVKLLKEMKLIK